MRDKGYKAVLFDLDGTLLDTLEDLAVASNRVLAGRGLPEHPIDAYRYFVGSGLNTLIERIIPATHRDPEQVQLFIADFEREYARNWRATTRPYPGIADLLDQLVARGLRLAVLSNKPQDFTRLCVETLLADWHFDPVFGKRPGVPKKPDPAAALEIVALLAMEPGEVLYLGDTGIDMQTAGAAGMDGVGVLWGFRDAAELKGAGAKALLARPLDLLALLG
ncbi:MAG: HAD family hydrolase [Desulfobulbus sp.]|jgi:phosphoglycolate phosphatase